MIVINCGNFFTSLSLSLSYAVSFHPFATYVEIVSSVDHSAVWPFDERIIRARRQHAWSPACVRPFIFFFCFLLNSINPPRHSDTACTDYKKEKTKTFVYVKAFLSFTRGTRHYISYSPMYECSTFIFVSAVRLIIARQTNGRE